ncbi:uncharacterized protein LOC143845697 isoform X2 [Tasmannia lanceolata]|uniref:uncharacterized protein LOC143845697 isoform X2 n=1 Tax=Tasmannia lanceolata TaxID=3420 RepID=UPI0040641DFD
MRSCKKPKENKIPQRGLGVAQLEKIRLLEQQKTFCFLLPNPQFEYSIPFQSRSDLNSSKPSISISTVHHLLSPPPPPLDFMPRNAMDFNHDLKGQNLDLDLSLPSLHTDSSSFLNSVCHAPVFVQRKIEQANVSSSSVSSGVNFQMEPPSNQNSNSTPWPEEQRRRWPFSLDNSPENPSFLREGRSSSITIHSNSKAEINPIKENRCMDSDFLTLASPTTKGNLKSGLLQFHGSLDDPFLRTNGLGSKQQPFYVFLPMEPSCLSVNSSDPRAEETDNIDLNLKL